MSFVAPVLTALAVTLLTATAFYRLCHQTTQEPPPGECRGKLSVREPWIVDDCGRVRIFHGFNSVVKGPPFYDAQLLNLTRLGLLRDWGFNVVRMGAMWAGAQPDSRSEFNETYVNILVDTVDQLDKFGIYAILDMHQDVLSSVWNDSFLYDGVPRWLMNSLPPSPEPYPSPFTESFSCDQWALAYLTKAVSFAFQQIYDNVAGSRDAMGDFWTKVASTFVGKRNVLGYELINEPWAGDVYRNPLLLLPGVAGSTNLAPLYNFLNSKIRQVDQSSIVFYEPVTWGILFNGNRSGTGFDRVPGGDEYRNRSVLSYHYYCWLLQGSGSEHYGALERSLCDVVIGPQVMPTIRREISRIGGSSFLTEFGLCHPDGRPDSVNTIECQFVLELADENLQSWTYWDSVFFNDGIAGGIDWNVVRSFSRVYARAISGTPIEMFFDLTTMRFRLRWTLDPAIRYPTEIFVPRLHYPNGFLVFATDGLSWTFNETTSLLAVRNDAIASQTTVTVDIYDKFR